MPLPTGDVWVQFPLIAVIVACFALAGVGIFTVTKWIWNEYKKQRDIELLWREGEERKRELAGAEQNNLWRGALLERDVRWETSDKITQAATKDLAGMMSHMIVMLADHDAQAKNILIKTDEVLENQEIIKDQTRRTRQVKLKET